MKDIMRIAAILLLAVACTSSRPIVPFGQSVTLRPGEVAEYPDRFTVTFQRVVDDSRCPPRVVCIQKGDVNVGLRVKSETVTLNFDHTPRATLFGRTIELREVGPREGYTATLRVY